MACRFFLNTTTTQEDQMAQKKRTSKTSNGTAVGARRLTPALSTLEKVLMVNSYTDRVGAARRKRVGQDKPKPKAAR
jgi:hypothetical protein